MNLMLRRRAMMVGSGGIDLPVGYTRLQYIYNTSNAFIDTGVLLTSNDTVEFVWTDQIASQGGDRMLCGTRPQIFSINLYYGLTRIHTAWGASGGFLMNSPDRRVRVEAGMFYTYQNGSVFETVDKTSYSFTATTNIYLFAYNNGSNTPQYPLKQAGIKIALIEGKFNGIPCIDPNNVVGMYDVVNGNFHTSPNGTAFVAGPVY